MLCLWADRVYETRYEPPPYRSSDHHPVRVGLRLEAGPRFVPVIFR